MKTLGVCNHVNKGFKTFRLTVAPAMILPENETKMNSLPQWEQKSYSLEKIIYSLLTITLRVERATSDEHFALAEFLPIP